MCHVSGMNLESDSMCICVCVCIHKQHGHCMSCLHLSQRNDQMWDHPVCEITSCHGMLLKGHFVQASATTTRAHTDPSLLPETAVHGFAFVFYDNDCLLM